MNTALIKYFIIIIFAVISVRPIRSLYNFDKYEGYKLYDIKFSNEKQNMLFYESFKDMIDIIIPSRTIERPMRILISPFKESKIIDYLNSNAIDYKIINENVAESIEHEHRVKRDTLISKSDIINFQNYQRFDVINNYLEYLQEQYPERVKIMDIGKSYEGRDLKTILITQNITESTEIQPPKPLIFIDAGIHAREWIAPATALYVIQQLVENSTYYDKELHTYDWLVWPVVNPDGYEYSHFYDRLWRKSRKPADNLNTSNCVGVDINRNFNFYWGYSGGSTDECSEIYQGPSAFSEPEAQALRDLLFRINSTCRMYLTLHSYGSYILYPWGFERFHYTFRSTDKGTGVSYQSTDSGIDCTGNRLLKIFLGNSTEYFLNECETVTAFIFSLPPSWKYLDAVARAGSNAIRKTSGTSYTVGGAAKVLYPASGASDDYAFAMANISVVLCMELPSGGNGFDPPADKIQPIVAETWSGIRAMTLEAHEYRSEANYKFLSLSVVLFALCFLNLF